MQHSNASAMSHLPSRAWLLLAQTSTPVTEFSTNSAWWWFWIVVAAIVLFFVAVIAVPRYRDPSERDPMGPHGE